MPSPFPYGSYLPSRLCGYTPQQVRAAYGVDKVSQTGRGVRVAIADLYASPTIVADVNRYSANHGLPPLTYQNFDQILPPDVNNIPPGDPCSASSWTTEETLDITAVHSMAPEAFIFYVGGACDPADEPDGGVAVEPIYEIIDNRLADIVSNSWLWNGEADVPPGRLKTDNAEFRQAAAQGMSVLFATGDDRDLTRQSLCCFGGPNAIASGSWPADSPYVTAVGGTSLLLKDASGDKSEFGWAGYLSIFTSPPVLNSAGTVITDQGWGPFLWFGGSGGGPSLVMLQPWYQKGVVPLIFATETYLSGGNKIPLRPPRRVIPDVAMLADPVTGFLIGETFPSTSPVVGPGCIALSKMEDYCEYPIGGTSLATPLLAGVTALLNEKRFKDGSTAAGFLNPALYRMHVGDIGSHAAIFDINAPTEPLGLLYVIPGVIGEFVTIDSYADSSGQVIENADSSLRSVPGYDNVTGLGVPNVPALIQALGSHHD